MKENWNSLTAAAHSGSDALWPSVGTRGGAAPKVMDLCYLTAQGETHLSIIREAVFCECLSCPLETMEGALV